MVIAMLEPLRKLLEFLEDTLDAEQQQRINDHHRQALLYEPVERLPLNFLYPCPSDGPFSPFPYPEAYDHPEKMLYNQLIYAHGTSILHHAKIGDDLTYTVRANCGVGVIASLFGARMELRGDDLPWVRAEQTPDGYAALLEVDPADMTRGLVPKVVGMYEVFREILERYPVVQRAVRMVLPDLQGPFDTAELLVGSSIFADFYERPEDLRRLLALLAEAQVRVARRLAPLLDDGPEGFSHQHLVLIRGRILIRDDSPIMISAEMYRRFVAEHDEYILRELGGGGIHYCGKGDHLIDEFLSLPSLRHLDLGQSYLNDLDAIYARARAKRVSISRVWLTKEELFSSDLPRRFPTGINMNFTAESFSQAREYWRRYLSLYSGGGES